MQLKFFLEMSPTLSTQQRLVVGDGSEYVVDEMINKLMPWIMLPTNIAPATISIAPAKKGHCWGLELMVIATDHDEQQHEPEMHENISFLDNGGFLSLTQPQLYCFDLWSNRLVQGFHPSSKEPVAWKL